MVINFSVAEASIKQGHELSSCLPLRAMGCGSVAELYALGVV